MVGYTEGRHAAEFILSEAEGDFSRANATIAASMTIVPGQVLGYVGTNQGAVTVGAPSGAGNAGGGTCTRANPAYSADVQEGTYTAIIRDVVAAGGIFDVIRPDGTLDGQATVGAAYDGQVKFTIADGAPDFAAGDKFTLAVSIAEATAAGEYKALDLTAADGAESAVAIAIYGATTAADETAAIAVLANDAVVNKNLLTWPAGITADQKAAAISQLWTNSRIKVR